MKKSVLVLASLVFLLVSAPSVLAASCCIEASDGGTGAGVYAFDASGVEITTPTQCADYSGSIFISECPGDIFDRTGCCCNDVVAEDFQTGLADFVYEPYCLAEGYEFSYLGGSASCDALCGGEAPGGTQYFVYLSLIDNVLGFAVPDVTATFYDANSDIVSQTVSGSDGIVNAGQLPAGTYTYELQHSQSFIYSDPVSGATRAYDCSFATGTLVVDDDENEVLGLTCIANADACTPSWTPTDPEIGWGTCVPYGDGYARFRIVTDLNDCGTTVGKPPEVDISGCADFIDEDPDEDLCGNGQLDVGEQCDYNALAADPSEHIYPGGSAPTCGAVLGQGEYEGPISCLDNCLLDTSQCRPTCGNTCLSIDQCQSCPDVCAGASFCDFTPSDEELTPSFLPGYTNEEDILLYYTNQEAQLDVIKDVIYEEGTKNVELSWELPSNNANNEYLLGFTVHVCEADGTNTVCNEDTRRTFSMNLNSKSQNVTGLFEKTNTLYCYNVCSELVDGRTLCTYEDTDLPCFLSGDAYCMGPHVPGQRCLADPFSDATTRHVYSCERGADGLTNNKLVQDEYCDPAAETPFVCAQGGFDVDNGGFTASCQPNVACSECNGLFGLYPHDITRSTVQQRPEGPVSVTCSELIFTGGTPNEFTGMCYLAKTQTVSERFESCEVESCYDYATRASCETDSCFRFTDQDGNDCEWIALGEKDGPIDGSLGDETGVGICRPKTESEQECGKCDEESPLGFCSDDICGMFGNCYYKEQNLHGPSEIREANFLPSKERNLANNIDVLQPTCVHARETSCYVYDTRLDCLGPGYDDSIDLLDVGYSGTPGQEERVSGRHQILNPSKDVFGFGVCAWNDNENDIAGYGCHKNSDARYLYDDVVERLDDCFDDGSIAPSVDCLKDNVTPVTVLALKEAQSEGSIVEYGKRELENLFFSVSDNYASVDDITTYVSFDQASIGTQQNIDDTYTYPITALDEARKVPANLIEPLVSGIIGINYYSVDSAQNLEVVRTDFVRLDSDGPQLLDHNFANTSVLVSNDNYLTTFYANFTVDVPANCDTSLFRLESTSDPVPFISGNIAAYGEEFNDIVYQSLPDGDYEFVVNCYDDNGNNFGYNEGFVFNMTFEGDRAITNPQPRRLITRYDDVIGDQIRIETGLPATCKFDTQLRAYDDINSDFTFNANSAGTTHTRDIADLVDLGIITASNPSGTYLIYPACKFTDSGEVTEEVVSDEISFTIDEIPPQITVQIFSEEVGDFVEYEEFPLNWTANKRVRLVCNDEDPQLPFVQFGCSEVSYCLGPTTTLDRMNCYDDYELQTSANEETIVRNLVNTGSLDLPHQIYSRSFLYYQVQDDGGNYNVNDDGDQEIYSVNLAIRNVQFDRPQFDTLEVSPVVDYSFTIVTPELGVIDPRLGIDPPQAIVETISPAACDLVIDDQLKRLVSEFSFDTASFTHYLVDVSDIDFTSIGSDPSDVTVNCVFSAEESRSGTIQLGVESDFEAAIITTGFAISKASGFIAAVDVVATNTPSSCTVDIDGIAVALESRFDTTFSAYVHQLTNLDGVDLTTLTEGDSLTSAVNCAFTLDTTISNDIPIGVTA